MRTNLADELLEVTLGILNECMRQNVYQEMFDQLATV